MTIMFQEMDTRAKSAPRKKLLQNLSEWENQRQRTYFDRAMDVNQIT